MRVCARYMIRVYNYMTAGVALTGVVAWLAYQAAGGDAIQVARRADQRADVRSATPSSAAR